MHGRGAYRTWAEPQINESFSGIEQNVFSEIHWHTSGCWSWQLTMLYVEITEIIRKSIEIARNMNFVVAAMPNYQMKLLSPVIHNWTARKKNLVRCSEVLGQKYVIRIVNERRTFSECERHFVWLICHVLNHHLLTVGQINRTWF